MMCVEKIDEYLLGLISLMISTSNMDWVEPLEQCRYQLKSDPVGARDAILSMFGGMGSLNDVLLYKDGSLLVGENIKFDTLREELYQACKYK